MKCRVCTKEITDIYIDFVGSNLSEHKAHCSEGHYSFYFSYGNTWERIGGIEIKQFYNETEEEALLQEKIIELAVELQKLKENQSSE